MSIGVPAAENRRLDILLRLFPYAGMFVLVLILWLPFGFKTTGLIEEWDIHAALDNGQQLFFVTPTSAMAVARGRPLEMLPFAVAYTLDPNSFTYYHVLMMLFFFGKLVVVYWLMLEFLPGHQLLALLIGLLFIIYPADTGLFSLRTIHIHSAVLAYLVGAYLLVVSQRMSNRSKWLVLTGAAFFIIFSLWQYPSALAAAAITPLFLLYFGRPKRFFWISTGAWYVSMAFATLYSMWAIRQVATDNSYDAQFLQQIVFSSDELKSMLTGVVIAYQRQVSGWIDAVGKLNYLPLFGVFVLIAVALFAGVGLWLLRRRDGHFQKMSVRRYVVLWVAGFVLFAVGIALYIPVPLLRFESFRAYIVAALGSAMVLALSLYFISGWFRRYRQPVFLLLALPFVGLAYVNAYQQQQSYVNYSLEQQNVLQQIVSQAPQIAPDTKIIVIDPTAQLNRKYMFYYGSRVQAPLGIIYGNPVLEVQYCPMEDGGLLGQSCAFDADGLAVTQITAEGTNELAKLPYDQLLLFSVRDDRQVTLLTAEEAKSQYPISGYNPDAQITGNQPPLRAVTLFSCEPALSCYRKIPPALKNTFELSTTDEIGLGWREAEVDAKMGVFRWSINHVTSVNVHMKHSGDLILDFNVLHWVEDSVINSLTLTVNGQPIPLTYNLANSSRLYHAVIPQSALGNADTDFKLIFKVDRLTPVPQDRLLGFALNGLGIRPA